MSAWNMNRTSCMNRTTIRGYRFHMNDRGRRVPSEPLRIDHGNAALYRKPDPSDRVGEYGLVPLDPFDVAEAVG